MEITPWWDKTSFAQRRPALEARARIMAGIRRWFDEAGFIEIDTPALQISPGLEPHLKAFATRLQTPEGEIQTRYLHTSPEFTMKKLLVAGMTKIYQLGHVFRNEQDSATHSAEFTMLEWYRVGAGTIALIEDCMALIATACTTAGTAQFSFNDMTCDPFAPPEILSIAEAFQRYCGIVILATAPDPLNPSLDLLGAAAHAIGIAPHDGDSWEDLFFRIMLERIEPVLGQGRLTFLTDYPVSMAALARPNPADPRIAERFEVYACGVELANAFGELTDPVLQRARFAADMDLKERLYSERYPIDEDFIAALTQGLPNSAGIALGFDRLVMLATGASDIQSVLWAPVM